MEGLALDLLKLVIFVPFVIVVCVCIYKFANKDSKIKTEYDERQKALKGRSYMYGFYTLVIWECFLTVLNAGGYELTSMPMYAIHSLGIFIGIILVCVHGIWTEAYWGLNNNKRRYIGVFAVLFVINVLPLVMVATHGNQLTAEDFPYENLYVTVMLIVLGITSLIKKAVDKKEEEE